MSEGGQVSKVQGSAEKAQRLLITLSVPGSHGQLLSLVNVLPEVGRYMRIYSLPWCFETMLTFSAKLINHRTLMHARSNALEIIRLYTLYFRKYNFLRGNRYKMATCINSIHEISFESPSIVNIEIDRF